MTSSFRAIRRLQHHSGMLRLSYMNLADCFLKKFNIPLQVQPQVFSALSLVSWYQILVYNKCATFPSLVLTTADFHQRMARLDSFPPIFGCSSALWRR